MTRLRPTACPAETRNQGRKKLKFSYKEQREWDTIEDDIAQLEAAVENLEKEIEASATNFTKLNELMKEKRREGSAARRKDGSLGLLKRSGGADRSTEEQVIL